MAGIHANGPQGLSKCRKTLLPVTAKTRDRTGKGHPFYITRDMHLPLLTYCQRNGPHSLLHPHYSVSFQHKSSTNLSCPVAFYPRLLPHHHYYSAAGHSLQTNARNYALSLSNVCLVCEKGSKYGYFRLKLV